MMKNLRTLMCVVGGVTLFGTGCGGPPQETPEELQSPATSEEQPGVRQQTVRMVCWSDLGIYDGPSTSNFKIITLHYGNYFDTDSAAFVSNGEYWVRGQWVCSAPYNCLAYGYVRWAGLC
ncbi:hypothetical protein [Corallococcus carmarthensis]|uniref:Uncharacterized protein n=1 Tax=Corallococcus carmarthensis TaxID=2316728 RepID=A0A3A8KU97_9BACT|nr:hypothetical protein [Corallococcus carmarthensis]RKH05564.1 hypothetical protein D7X32_07425 [Corallococcus carmarthensis]